METNSGKRSTLSDERIIDLYFARDQIAIDETDKKYGRYLYAIAYRIVHDRPDCEECLNDTYFGAWNAMPPKRPNILQVFLSKIMRNVAIDKFRKQSAQKRISSELVVSLEELDDCIGDLPTPEEELAVKELARILNEYLRDMNDKEQYIFVCRYYYSDRTVDIANMLGISKSTVLRELGRLRSNLKERLTKEGYNL